jgi:hypothetical protein
MNSNNKYWLYFSIIVLFFITFLSLILTLIYYYYGSVPFFSVALFFILGFKGIFFIYMYLKGLKERKDNKDSFQAKLAFFLSLFCWVPLFNFGIAPISFLLGYKAYKKYNEDSMKYGGLMFSSLAMIISLSGIILTIVGLVIYLFSADICLSSVCVEYFNMTDSN